ncbi:MAG: S8 family serine peptidase, partial [Proteobacteria bacterium]|nr:S8 family serine peptidase [Pseudomonadota bacterium]
DGGASDGGASDGGASDGGASDGGAWSSIPSWSFITPVVQPPRDHRHWGALKAYDQLRDPNLWTDYFDADEVPGVIRMALKEMQKKKIRIAVFDTGIDFTHPDLRGKAKAGCDITGTSGYPADDNGHGTHIAGTLISSLGLALPVELYSVKILDKFASGDLFNIVLALQWAIDHRMDIVNMSLSYRDDSFAVRSAVQTAFEHGLIMVAAVGNRSNWDSPGPSVAADGAASDGGASDGGASDGGASDGGASDGGASDGGASDGGASDGGASDGGASDGGAGLTSGGMDWYSVMYPARYPQVIAVGASTPWGDMAAFSNSGEEMDLTAPGVKIISTNLYKWGGFGICSGTSMATPHVSGAVAMMLALDPNLTATEIKDILRETSDPLGDPVGIGDLNLISALGSVWQTAIWEQKMRMVMKAETEDFDDGQGKRSNLASGENRK